MAQADLEKTVNVPRDTLFETITRYEDYPEFVEGVKKVEVDRIEPGKAHIKYHLWLIKDIEYSIEILDNKEQGTVEWVLIESAFLKKNVGKWKLDALDENRTKVFYSLEVEFKIPVPGLILKKLVKSNLPTMVDGFVKRAQSL